jgi:hypothetical protein
MLISRASTGITMAPPSPPAPQSRSGARPRHPHLCLHLRLTLREWKAPFKDPPRPPPPSSGSPRSNSMKGAIPCPCPSPAIQGCHAPILATPHSLPTRDKRSKGTRGVSKRGALPSSVPIHRCGMEPKLSSVGVRDLRRVVFPTPILIVPLNDRCDIHRVIIPTPVPINPCRHPPSRDRI